ncbi:MAG: hypothetical protein M3Y42_02050 [Actinomycetota bacterium]|nr:hypothetical protein [Actinomycetota bacterium]
MSSLSDTYGSAKHPDRPVVHDRPAGMSDATVDALGKLSAALETVEHARGHLYAFHRLSGTSDLALQEALVSLREAGHQELAAEIDEVLVGRDVIAGRWTFQLVEDYDAGYWSIFRAVEEQARNRLGNAAPHVYEAEMKHREQRA